MIVEKAAALFNSRGYFGASMSDLMAATGLEKGGIYNHFSGKDELALEAFDFAVRTNGQIIMSEVAKHSHAADKLNAFVLSFCGMGELSPIPGGCPLLNSAIECDDAHPEMKERVKRSIKVVLRTLESIIKQGIERSEIRKEVNAASEAKVIFTSIEGAIMLSRLFDDAKTMDTVKTHLLDHIQKLRSV
jgi:TetR/AcrR family transcriptional regulator, transcriptional repressor for nem operon